MSNNDKIIKEALERTGSLENLFEEIVQSETEELRQLQQTTEAGPEHPDQYLLRDYALGRVSRQQDNEITKHLMVCSKCSETVFDIQYVEPIRAESEESWLARIKEFVSNLSFPIFVQFPALEAVRGPEAEKEIRSYVPGEDLAITLKAPANGYVTIFHVCEETGEVNLIFPSEPYDDPKVLAGEGIAPVEGNVDGPAGKHVFKVFWTKDLLIDFTKLDLSNDEQVEVAKLQFFKRLESLEEADWRVATFEYTVSTDE